MNQTDTQEIVSALADGQLRGEEFARGVELAALDADGRQAWLAYHLIGDVLRMGSIPPGAHPEAFLRGVRVSLEREQPRPPVRPAVNTEAPVVVQSRAANDESFRWKMVAGFASVAAVAAIAWSVAGAPGKPEQAQLAGTNPTVLQASERGVIIRDPQLDQFMAAHRQLGGASVLPAGFVRNATLEGPVR